MISFSNLLQPEEAEAMKNSHHRLVPYFHMLHRHEMNSNVILERDLPYLFSIFDFDYSSLIEMFAEHFAIEQSTM